MLFSFYNEALPNVSFGLQSQNLEFFMLTIKIEKIFARLGKISSPIVVCLPNSVMFTRPFNHVYVYLLFSDFYHEHFFILNLFQFSNFS